MEDKIQEKISSTSKKRLEILKQRSKRCVCKYCGGTLKVRQIILTSYEDARIELFCKECNRIEFGVEPEIYDNAKSYVEEMGFNVYPDLDDSERTKQMTIAKICEILTWQNQNIGILAPEGYKVPICKNNFYTGECVTLSDMDLDENETVVEE